MCREHMQHKTGIKRWNADCRQTRTDKLKKQLLIIFQEDRKCNCKDVATLHFTRGSDLSWGLRRSFFPLSTPMNLKIKRTGESLVRRCRCGDAAERTRRVISENNANGTPRVWTPQITAAFYLFSLADGVRIMRIIAQVLILFSAVALCCPSTRRKPLNTFGSVSYWFLSFSAIFGGLRLNGSIFLIVSNPAGGGVAPSLLLSVKSIRSTVVNIERKTWLLAADLFFISQGKPQPQPCTASAHTVRLWTTSVLSIRSCWPCSLGMMFTRKDVLICVPFLAFARSKSLLV